MEKIINKLDVLSREITKFVIDNELNEEPFFTVFNEKNNTIFKIYEAKGNIKIGGEEYTCFYLPNDIIEIVHTTGKITLSMSSTKEQLSILYQKLEKEYNNWKESLTLEDIKEKKKTLKLKKKQELELELSKLEEELNEL